MNYKFKGVSTADNKLIYCECDEKPIFEARGKFGVYKFNGGEIYSWTLCGATDYHYKDGSYIYGGDECEAIINGVPTYGEIGFNSVSYVPQFVPIKVDRIYGNQYYTKNCVPLSEIFSENITFKKEKCNPEWIKQHLDLIDLTK